METVTESKRANSHIANGVTQAQAGIFRTIIINNDNNINKNTTRYDNSSYNNTNDTTITERK